MKKGYKFIMLTGVIFSLWACHDESSLTPEYEYGGPVPAIADGPSEAQKICYELYKTYDLQVYYTLAGEEALQTILGTAQDIFYGIPIEAGDETTSAAFLKLMKKFYGFLPEELAKGSAKRHVLVKVGANDDLVNAMYMMYFGIPVSSGIYSIGMTGEAQKGIVYWGDMNDELGEQLDVWKYSLCFSYFDTRLSNDYHPELPVIKDLIKVSSGKYLATLFFNYDVDALFEAVDMDSGELNMDYLLSNGFVNADSWFSVRNDTGEEEGLEYLDLVAYVSWIACTPLAERQDIFESYPLVKQKYDIVVSYCKEHLDFDIEVFSKSWSVVTIE